MADQAMYPQGNQSVFVGGASGPCSHPLQYLKKGEEGRKRRKFYIYPDVTHRSETR
jgi:hypothetical protein